MAEKAPLTKEVIERYINMNPFELAAAVKDGRLSREERQDLARAGGGILAQAIQEERLDDPACIDDCEKLMLLYENEEAAKFLSVYVSILLGQLQKAEETEEPVVTVGLVGFILQKVMEAGASVSLQEEIPADKIQELEVHRNILEQCRSYLKELIIKTGLIEYDPCVFLDLEPEEKKALDQRLEFLGMYYQEADDQVVRFLQILEAVLADGSDDKAEEPSPPAKPEEPEEEDDLDALLEENPLEELRSQTPNEVRTGSWRKNLPEYRRAYLVQILLKMQEFKVNDLEKLLWLEADDRDILWGLERLKETYEKKAIMGWLGGELFSLRKTVTHAAEKVSNTGFLRLLGGILLLVLAGALLFLPGVKEFFTGGSDAILGVLGLIIFIVGCVKGSFILGAILFGVWVGVAYLINLAIGIDRFFQLIPVLVLVILAVMLLRTVKAHSGGSARRAKNRRKEALAKRSGEMEELRDYILAVQKRLSQVPTIGPNDEKYLKNARQYYSYAMQELDNLGK